MAHIDGTAGNDVINGTPNDDLIHPGAGNDIVSAGAGNDIVADTLDASHFSIGIDGNDLINAGAGDDTIFSNDFSTSGVDVLDGAAGNDTIYSGDSSDQLLGRDGDDKLTGDDGNDTLLGDFGNDVLEGGFGKDVMDGGVGNDLYEFNYASDNLANPSANDSAVGENRDVIRSFNFGTATTGDKIDLLKIDANALVPGNEAFQYISTAPFSAPGQVRVSEFGTSTVVQLNTDADLFAESEIRVDDGAATAASWEALDFIL